MEKVEIDVVVPRHADDCDVKLKGATPRTMKECQCPKYLYVRRDRTRISAHTRNWERAEELARQYASKFEAEGIPKQIHGVMIADAVDRFLESRPATGATKKTIDNLRPDCNQFKKFATDLGVKRLSEVDTQLLDKWMLTWKGRQKFDRNGTLTAECTLYTKAKKRKHIVMFFKYCLNQGWIKDNPATKMLQISRRNQPSAIPKIPFTREQMEKILKSAEAENHCRRSRTMIQLMRRTGLSIMDATRLERSRLTDNNRLELYRSKTGEGVYLLLEPKLATELRKVPALDDPRYFFWTGNGDIATAANNWGKVFRRIFRRSKVVLQDRYGNPLRPSSHFLRNTFAKETLETGLVSIDQLAVLLGDDPTTVREHYFKWVPDLQQALDDAVRATWSSRARKSS